jgi:hypothetical protein
VTRRAQQRVDAFRRFPELLQQLANEMHSADSPEFERKSFANHRIEREAWLDVDLRTRTGLPNIEPDEFNTLL